VAKGCLVWDLHLYPLDMGFVTMAPSSKSSTEKQTCLIKIIETSFEDVLEVIKNLPEFHSPPTIAETRKRCLNVPYLAIVAEHKGTRIGCKLGYQENKDVFYSWIGGVLPEYRKHGVAQNLLEYQEEWAWRNDYKVIKVKSMNRFPEMLRFLIANSYQVVGVEGNAPENLKVLFEKVKGNQAKFFEQAFSD
jgi:GNAT superfamily N-acetyltransferase